MHGQGDEPRVRRVAATMLLVNMLFTTGPAFASPKHKEPGVTPAGAMVTSFPAAAKPLAVVPYGSYCLTPLGRTGPGLIAPLGSPCTGTSAGGRISGQTVN